MFIRVMKYMALFYYCTWIVWPFVFVFGLSFGLKELMEQEKASGKGLFWAAVALMLMMAGVVWALLDIPV